MPERPVVRRSHPWRGSSVGLSLWIAAATVAGTGVLASGPSGDALVETVVHTTLRPPNWDVYLFEKPGGAPRRLTDDPALDYNTVFSPDGRWIVFTSERAGRADLWALDLSRGGAPVRLTRHHAMDDAAAFAPDGRGLAFVSTREGSADIFVMPFAPGDATAEERAANLTRRPGGDFNPAFSPDGRRVAFSRQDELWEPGARNAQVRGNYGVQLHVMDADGGNVRRLSEPGPGFEMPGFGFRLGRVSGSPAWSFDGGTLLYYQVSGNNRAQIRRVALDGSGDAAVAPDGLSPALRPDRRIAFTRPQPLPDLDEWDVLTRTGHIVSVAPDGSDLRSESDNARSYFAPAFDRAGRMVCHGPGPVEGLPVVRESIPFAPPDARREMRLTDRTLAVRGIRGYFPAFTPAGELLSSLPSAGYPAPPSLHALSPGTPSPTANSGRCRWRAVPRCA